MNELKQKEIELVAGGFSEKEKLEIQEVCKQTKQTQPQKGLTGWGVIWTVQQVLVSMGFIAFLLYKARAKKEKTN